MVGITATSGKGCDAQLGRPNRFPGGSAYRVAGTAEQAQRPPQKNLKRHSCTSAGMRATTSYQVSLQGYEPRSYRRFVPSENKAAALAQLRIALTTFFALGGFLFAGWAVRIPALKEQTDASARSLGLALLCMSASAVVTMLLMGRLCQRFGSRQMTIATSLLLSLCVLLPPLTHSPVAFGLVLLVFGVGYGGIDVAVNSVAVDVVAEVGRPIMSSFHASNSVGSLVGAGLGGLVAPHLSPSQHMLLATLVGVTITVAAGRMLLRHPLAVATPAVDPQRDAGATGGRLRASTRIGVGVGLFGGIGLCAAYAQGALDTWVPLHITEDLNASQGVGAAGYATVALTIALGRLCGTALIERMGQSRVLVTGGLVASAGMVAAALAPVTWLVFLGLAVTGLGLANIFPAAMAGAGAAGGSAGVATAATLGYSGILLAPPVIGFLADALTLPIALNTISLLIALAAALAYAARNVNAVPPDQKAPARVREVVRDV